MAKERLIKRYTNRKLYDTQQSRYVTLDDIAKLVRDGEDVHVIDNDSGDDLTSVTFAQIILEEEKRKTNLISVPFLRKLIRSGEATVQDWSDRASRGIEVLGELAEKAGDSVREVVEEGGRAVDEGRSFIDDLFHLPQKRMDDLRDTARKSVDKIRQSETVQNEVSRLEKTIHGLEEMVAKLRLQEDGESEDGEEMGNGAAAEGNSGSTARRTAVDEPVEATGSSAEASAEETADGDEKSREA